MTHSHRQMKDSCGLCNEFARILGAEILTSSRDLCAVTFLRDIDARILGRPTNSPLALAALFSFESMDSCGTIGLAKGPYPIAYNFLTSKYQSTMDFKAYLNSFKDIGHINLIKVENVTNENTPKGTYKYFIEIETIEPSVNGNTSFAYYYGFVYMEQENGKYKISNIDLRGQDFLCAAYHGWRHNADLYVDIVYGGWCGLIKKRYPTEQKGYVKNIYVSGTDGREYKFEFFQLTNGTDVEIQQFVKNANNQWEPITIDVEKCLKRWACPYRFYKP